MYNRIRTCKTSKRNNIKEKQGRKSLSTLLASVLAITLLSGIPVGNMGSVQAATTLNNPRISSDGVVTWDCVYFGSYPQSDATGETKDPIKWRVLSVDGKDAFLVADTNLDVQRYNGAYVSVTWETCTMRSWLNGYGSSSNVCGKDYSSDNFLDRAFTASEQNAIKTTAVVNADNPAYGTAGGNSTQDKIFLLSYDEVTNPAYGFSSDYSTSDNARKRINTAYVAKGGTTGSSYGSEGSTAWWCLRSPGWSSIKAMNVDRDGAVDRYNGDVGHHDRAVCPALHLNLSSSNLWSYAGTVRSDGESTEGDNPPVSSETAKYATSTTSRYAEQVEKVLSEEKFKTYSATLRNISCVIPGLEQTNMVNSGCDNMVPQGVCVAGDLLLISAYCHSHSNETTGTTWYEGKEFQGWCHHSVLYVMDKKTQRYITTIVLGDLPAGCHVGGLAYDGDYDMVAIADSESKQKKVWFMDCSTVREAVESGRDSEIVTGLSSANVNNTPSFLLYFGHRYYVGTFNKGEDTNTKMNEYVLEYAPGTASPYILRATGRKINLPPQCQGVAVTADNDMFCSCSYGRGNASKMYVYKLKRTESGGLVSTAKATDQFRYGVTFPNMTEDMDMYGDSLLTCYESAANNYQQSFSRCKYPMDRITISSAYGLLKNQSQIRTFSSRVAEDDAALSMNGDMNVAVEGECGANLQYTLYTDGSMSVTGQGDMEDYVESAAPWAGMKAEIIKLVIGAGVDSIGAGAFADCENLQSVEVSALSDEDRTFTISSRAFAGCTALQTVILPDKTFDIAKDAFSEDISVELQSDADSVAQYCGNYETLTSHKHDYSFTKTVPADCLSAGYDVYTCSCGAEECRDLTESTGEHQYEEISRTDANCTESGTILYECRICGVCCSEELELTDHVWVKGDVTAATEQAQGYTIYTCSMCGETEQRDYVDYVASGGENSENVGKTEEGIGQMDNPISDTESVAIGTQLTSGAANYIVTEVDEKGGMVAYTASKKAKKTVVIPDTVVYNGVTYKVTSIEANAFKNNKKLESVTIGKNIKKIGKNAFSGCKNLKKITIKSTVLKTVGKNAIKNIHKKAVIKCPKKQLKKYKKLFKKSTGYKRSMKIKK
ncbi:MAG: leucine-rich repeat domain-containing protein [Lachnospiraceae bacterium]|nr:leucine-rich repeat domain-containing protein [Lachnospiraceae bacterium]